MTFSYDNSQSVIIIVMLNDLFLIAHDSTSHTKVSDGKLVDISLHMGLVRVQVGVYIVLHAPFTLLIYLLP